MYTEKRLSLLQVGDGAADDLSGTGVHGTSHLVGAGMSYNRAMAHVSVVTVGAATVLIKRRPLFGSATGESVLATLLIPAATVAGTIVYQDIDPVNLDPGDEIVSEVTVAATSGSAHYMHEVEEHSDQPSEQADMLKSL